MWRRHGDRQAALQVVDPDTPAIRRRGSEETLADAVLVAETVLERLLGSIPWPPGPGRALLLPGVWWVHTAGMRGSLDVAYLDGSLRVVRMVRSLRPWRVAPPAWGARHALEMAAGGAERIRAGDALEIPGWGSL